MKRIFYLLLLSVPLVVLNCAAQNLEKVTIAEYGEYPLYTALYLAESEGLFKKEGLDVTIVPAGGDEKVFAALLSHDAEFGVGDPLFTAISGERGKPGKIVFSLLQNVPAFGIALDKKVPEITSPEMLKGFSVATYPSPSTSYTLQKRLFEMGGLSPNITEIAYGALIPALKANRVDIILENEPNASTAVANGGRVVYSMGTFFPDFAFTGVSVLPELIKEKPALIQKVVNALKSASVIIYSNPELAITVLAKRFPELKTPVISSAIHNVVKAETFSIDGITKKSGWDAAVNLRKAVGDLKSEARFEDYVITTFAENANR